MYCRLKMKLSPPPPPRKAAPTKGHMVALCDFGGLGVGRGIGVATKWACLLVHFRAT